LRVPWADGIDPLISNGAAPPDTLPARVLGLEASNGAAPPDTLPARVLGLEASNGAAPPDGKFEG
jgi:hypothetical protein